MYLLCHYSKNVYVRKYMRLAFDTFLTFNISNEIYGYLCIFCHWIALCCVTLPSFRMCEISFILRATVNREANDGLDVVGCGHGGGSSDGGCGGGAVVAEVVYLDMIGCKDTNCGCVRTECWEKHWTKLREIEELSAGQNCLMNNLYFSLSVVGAVKWWKARCSENVERMIQMKTKNTFQSENFKDNITPYF